MPRDLLVVSISTAWPVSGQPRNLSDSFPEQWPGDDVVERLVPRNKWLQVALFVKVGWFWPRELYYEQRLGDNRVESLQSSYMGLYFQNVKRFAFTPTLYLSVFLAMDLSIYLSLHQFIFLSICLYIYPYFYLSSYFYGYISLQYFCILDILSIYVTNKIGLWNEQRQDDSDVMYFAREPAICPSVSLSFYLYINLSLYLSIDL